jgi:hypothetical protein
MRTFLLMVGSAVCGIAIFVAAVYGYFYYQFARLEPGDVVRFPPRNEKTVSVAPPIVETERFFGSHASWAGEFSSTARQTVLAAGPGKLVGSVTSGGKPLQGLRVRLALNGAVMSQWTTSGADGKYEIPVPYATYRVDGYELDSSSANTLLSGKTDGRRHHMHMQETVVVAEGKPGKGLDFDFVDPVRKKGPFGDISAAQPVIFSWEAYPNAASYRLQLVEQKDPRDYASQRYVFEWKQRPVVSGTSVNLAEHGVTLKKGYSYTVEIEALDEPKQRLSEAPRNVHKADFRVPD